ncbi:inositol monophosphatase [Pelagicoccus sp. NFK12]|uniref:Inositol monophosphatase n=1 Tax=Pelagicoccus enzymogenes TaxID=2773457 RepID=A0A927F8F9_9BACT|nr:inositol monophosphatase [Pelagicoccus enzymogenes]MBD5780217.1 inositol monophosphatase [Pelagicoccus enzymogenes]MDQ8198520.1 inositol monophosphatase [Pelagicoccus enzymogenes]
MENTLEGRIAYGKKAVLEQVAYFTAQFGDVASQWKFDGSRVTEADLHLSRVFSERIAAEFPSDQFFSEELEHGTEPIEVKPGYSWLLDPIDGTNNFARSIPNCSISLALLENGNPVYGYVYDHGTRKLVHGGRGHGLWLDEQRVQRKEAELNSQSLIATQTLADETALADDDALRMAFKLRAFGSSAIHMAYTALGWLDGVIAHRVKAWDIAGGMALLAAVGGSTRFFDTEVFPMKTFSSKASGFAHIAGSQELCDSMERAIGKETQYRW